MDFKINLGKILIITTILLILFLIFLIFFQKRLQKKVIKKRGKRNYYYLKIIDNLLKNEKNSNPEEISKIAKQFFKEAFEIERVRDYSELAEIFKKENRKKEAEFCSLIEKELYSKKEIEESQKRNLLLLLAEIVDNNPILTLEEKEEINQSKSFIQKIKEKYQTKIKPKLKFLSFRKNPDGENLNKEISPSKKDLNNEYSQ